MTAEVDNFLEHYGVKGMRWGKRRASGDVEVSKNKGPIDKDRLKEERKKLYSKVGDSMNSPGQRTLSGAAIVGTLMTGGTIGTQVIGAQMMAGAGFSKGKTMATAILGGAPGAVLMIELQARKNARA